MNILGSWKLILMQIIMCFTLGYISFNQNTRNKHAAVDCFHIGLHQQVASNLHQHNIEASTRSNETTVVTKITKLGILQCVLRNPHPKPLHQTSQYFNQNQSSFNSSEISPPGKPNGPQIIVLPAAGSQPSDNDYPEEPSISEEAPDPDEGSGVEQDELSDVDQFEVVGGDDKGREIEGPVIAPQKLLTRRRARNKKSYPTAVSLWSQLTRPIAKLHLAKNSSSRASKQHTKLIRLKRQATPAVRPVDPLEQIVRILLEDENRTRPGSALATTLFQQLLGSFGAFTGQVASGLLRQTTQDLPIHMANIGQLLSNVLTALTVNNPVISNSPALLRVQQATKLSQSSNSSVNLTNSTESVNVQDTPIGDATPARPFEERLAVLESTLRTLRSLTLELLRDRASRFGGQPTSTTTTPSSAEPLAPPLDDEEAELMEEIRFVKRLNDLTLGVGPRAVSLSARQGNSSSMGRSSGRIRKKRSIGSLLLYGPFSKFYLAMLINKMLKYQSGILTQAVMSELVRRYVVPGFGSMAQVPNIVGLLGQLKQGLATNQNLTTLSNGFLQAQGESSRPISFSAQNTQNSPIPLVGGQSALVDADCQLINQLDGSPVPLEPPIPPLAEAPINLLASALNNPAFTIDHRGIAYSSPITQSSYLIPNPLTGPYSLQSLLKAIYSNPASGLAFGSPSGLAGSDLTGQLQLSSLNGTGLQGPHLTQQVSSLHHLLRAPNRHKLPLSSVRKFKGSNTFVSKASMQHLLNQNFPQVPVDDSRHEINEQENFLLNANSSDKFAPATILDHYLKNASPSQLIELLSLIGSQHKPPVNKFSGGGSQVTEDLYTRPQRGSDKVSDLFNEIIARQAQDQPKRQEKLAESADEIADRVLNKTLELLLSPNRHTSGNGRILKETSDQLAGSVAELVKNLNSESYSISKPPAVETHEKGANLMEKLVDLTSHKNQTRQQEPQLEKLMSASPNIESITHTEAVEHWPRFDPLRRMKQQNKQRADQIDWAQDVRRPSNNQSNMPETMKFPSPTGRNNNTEISSIWSPTGSSIQPTKHNTLRYHTRWSNEQPSRSYHINTSQSEDAMSEYGYAPGGHPFNLTGLNLSQPDAKSSLNNKLSVEGQRFISHSLGMRKALVHQQQQQQHHHHHHQQQIHQIMSQRPHQPLSGLHVDKGQAQATSEQLPRDPNKTNKTSSSHLIMPAHSLDANGGSVDTADGGANKTASKQKDLNNLAMALNVMNMVLLNQKLADGSATTGNSKGAKLQQQQQQSGAYMSRLVVRPTSGSQRLVLVGGPQQLQALHQPPIRPTGNFVLLPRPQLLLSTKSGRRLRLRNRNRHNFPHNLYGQRQQLSQSAGKEYNPSSAGRGGDTGAMAEYLPKNPSSNTTTPTVSKPAIPPTGELERENPLNNHRMIHPKLEPSLPLMGAKQDIKSVSTPANYHFQPLPIVNNGNNLVGHADKSLAGTNEKVTLAEQHPESEHATRWNDVLQHLNLG